MKRLVWLAFLLLLLTPLLASCTCETCKGEKLITCRACGGIGTEECENLIGVADCSVCGNDGSYLCPLCNGTGETISTMSPPGFPVYTRCNYCHGAGNVSCTQCDAGHDCDDCDDGEVDCSHCNGVGKVRCPDCKEEKEKK